MDEAKEFLAEEVLVEKKVVRHEHPHQFPFSFP